jgi:hypothetical protein
MTMKNLIEKSRIRLFVVSTTVVAAIVLRTIYYPDNLIIQTKYKTNPVSIVYNGTVYLITSHDKDDKIMIL